MQAPPIVLGPQVLGDLASGAAREWLVADGVGGYASGTASGLRTRRYHGLLVVADGSPARRTLAVAALDPVLVLPGGKRVPLGVHEWAGGVVAPAGHELLERFDLTDGLPRWRWRVGDVVVERELALVHGRPSLAVVHRLVSGGPVRIEVDAVVSWRDVHGERTATGPPPRVEPVAAGALLEGAVRLRGPGWEPGGDWWRSARTREEAARGLTDVEDLWRAGAFVGELATPGDVVEVSAWAGGDEPPPAPEVVGAARRRAATVTAGAGDGTDAALLLAADAFVTTAPDVVAGYPWFGTWSRDTLTSYEGLFLEPGRVEEGRRLLEVYAGTLSEGMLANTADTGQLEHNTADATLWLLHAVERHVVRTGDTDLGVSLLPALDDVVAWHVRGTRYGLRIDDDGLLTQGAEGLALTWMDARTDGVAVTPRIGKAVELQGLWLRGLGAVRALRTAAGRDDGDLARLEEAGRRSFAERFPLPGGGLHDLVDGPAGDDAALRPNALLAADLLGPAERVALLDRIRPLLTPLGPRSLDPDDAAYRPRHRGGSWARDVAYHQGTVWPWLVGPWVDAALAAGVDVGEPLAGLEAHLGEHGLGSVSETADGAAPHGATGCPWQAWSVAEVLRARRRLGR